MSFRITTNGMFHSYRGNLSRANRNLFNSMTRVETGRKFNSYAEDPAAANRAFQMRRSYWNTGNQIDNTNYLLSKFQSGWDALGAVVDGNVDNPGLDGILTSLRGITGTAGAGRPVLGQTLISTAKAIVGAMNVRYGDTYVFAGADGLNVPFTWSEDGKLLYRGIDVDTPDPKSAAKELGLEPQPLTSEQFGALENYDSIVDDPDNPTSSFSDYLADEGIDPEKATYDDYAAWYADTYDAKKEDVLEYADLATDYAALQEMNNESTLVDIGLGFRLDGETINPATAYNSALSGIQVLGFGVDEDGDAMNIVSLMRELGEIFNRCNAEDGEYATDEDAVRADELVVKLRSAVGRVQEQHAVLDGKSDYLKKNLVQLDDNKFNLNEEILDVEEMDMAAAIQDMMWAQYTYNAALRIGTQILSQSLFDYFN